MIQGHKSPACRQAGPRCGCWNAQCGRRGRLAAAGGATLWDGTDFLSWGLMSPDGTPQNKFEEYRNISITASVYQSYLNSTLSKYTKGKVGYYGLSYNIPASVFTDEANWKYNSPPSLTSEMEGGPSQKKRAKTAFNYTTETGSHNLTATGAAGYSIFWKKTK